MSTNDQKILDPEGPADGRAVLMIQPDAVSKGLQTWAGYGGAAASALLAVITFLLTQETSYNLPPYVQLGLMAIAAALTVVTGQNRSKQAIANTEHAAAATRVITAARASDDGAEPALPADDGAAPL